MKNLLDRLEDEVLAGLKDNTKKYPSSVESALKALEENYCWLSLTVGQVHGILMFSNIPYEKRADMTFKFGENIIKDEK